MSRKATELMSLSRTVRPGRWHSGKVPPFRSQVCPLLFSKQSRVRISLNLHALPLRHSDGTTGVGSVTERAITPPKCWNLLGKVVGNTLT